MKYIKRFDEINEGKLTQFALKTIISSINGLQKVVKMIKGTYVPIKMKDKTLEKKTYNDLFQILDYAIFDTIKYYFSKKYKQEANRTSRTALMKKRCDVDVYDKIDSILSTFSHDNIEFSSDASLKAKQEVELEKTIDTVKKFKGLFKNIDDNIAETAEFINGIKDIMKDLDPRNPDNLSRDKEDTLDVFDRGLKKLDKMQNPDIKDINDLLDKVSKYGIDSLTSREKSDLEKHSKL